MTLKNLIIPVPLDINGQLLKKKSNDIAKPKRTLPKALEKLLDLIFSFLFYSRTNIHSKTFLLIMEGNDTI